MFVHSTNAAARQHFGVTANADTSVIVAVDSRGKKVSGYVTISSSTSDSDGWKVRELSLPDVGIFLATFTVMYWWCHVVCEGLDQVQDNDSISVDVTR